jgi:hypothetical protein
MKRALTVLIVLATLLFAVQQKRKPRPPEIEILELNVHRTEELVTLDGRVKNIGEMPAERLVVEFDFRDPDNRVVTTKKGPIDEEILDPDQESAIQLQTKDAPRFVTVSVRAHAARVGDVKVKNAGPFVIE